MSNLNNMQFNLQSSNVVETRLKGTRVSAFCSDFFSNSGHFFVLKSLATIVMDGRSEYLTHPPDYMLIFATLVQSGY